VASITDPQLAIAIDRAHDTATITVDCDVEFTDFEVNAMMQLGLTYSLRCDLLNMDMLYPASVVVFAGQHFPRQPRLGERREHATFEAASASKLLPR
jgi:hypothetical protein